MTSSKSYHQRLVYLLTYSRADISRFPIKQHFANVVVEAWKSCGIEISHWVVSIEGHAVTDNDGEMNMFHYHMALKLAKRGGWLQVRRFLDETFSIQVHFSWCVFQWSKVVRANVNWPNSSPTEATRSRTH